MAATAPAGYGTTARDRQPELEDSDQDAEGEDDVDMFEAMPLQQTDATTISNGNGVDTAANDVAGRRDAPTPTLDAEDTDKPTPRKGENNKRNKGVRGHKRIKRVHSTNSARAEAKSDGEDEELDASYQSDSSGYKAISNHDSPSVSDEESEGDGEWEAESNGQDEDAEVDEITPNNCIVCGQDEEHDPGEEFEECLACSVCGDHCHRQCAREQGHFSNEDEPKEWRCPSCVGNKLEPDITENSKPKRRSVPSNIAKDLLPVNADTTSAESHSIFNSLILDGDPLDGSRSLRKRKLSAGDEGHRPVTRKRQKVEPGVLEAPDLVDSNTSAGIKDTVAETEPSRPRRTRHIQKAPCSVSQRKQGKLILSFNLDRSRVNKILSSRRRPQNQRRRPPKPPPPATPALQQAPSHFAPVNPTPYTAPFYTFHDRENDELKSKPYGGILSEADADTSKTLPLHVDREKFESARREAEDEWRQKIAMSDQNGEAPRASQKLSGPPSKIKCISFGGYEIETWYAAPYPEEYSRNKVLYICEFCLKYMSSDFVAWRHKLKCPAKHPPGDEIYRDGTVSVFEVDGRKNPVYCQNLCLLAKLFLGSKTLYYDVEPFMFYVMTEYDDLGCHFVGYFSKEKRPSSSNNVSCILTLPIHQRKGYGNLLIDFSYLLTRIEGKVGSPEKPLSDMGLVSYRNYWRLVLCYQLRDQSRPMSIADIADRTGMTPDDIVSGLEGLCALVRDPVTKTYALRLDFDYFERHIGSWEEKGYVQLNPDALVWTPYVMGRSNQTHYDRAPIHTVAPRDDQEVEEPKAGGKPEGPVEGKSQGANPLVRVDGTDGVAVNGQTTPPPLDAPPGPPSTSVLSYTDASNNMVGSRYGSATPSNPALNIPPTRFEIFPPPNGTAKRRPGRPFGSTGRGRPRPSIGAIAPSPGTSGRNTPKKKSTLAVSSSAPAVRSPQSLRRGRSSKLVDNVVTAEGSTEGSTPAGESEMANVDGVAAEAGTQETEFDLKDGDVDEQGRALLEAFTASKYGGPNGVGATPSHPTNGNDGVSPTEIENDIKKINGIGDSSNDSRADVDGIDADTADDVDPAASKDNALEEPTSRDTPSKALAHKTPAH